MAEKTIEFFRAKQLARAWVTGRLGRRDDAGMIVLANLCVPSIEMAVAMREI
jgi:hypothetical protein